MSVIFYKMYLQKGLCVTDGVAGLGDKDRLAGDPR